MPSRSEPAASGQVRSSSEASSCSRCSARLASVERPRRAHPGADLVAVALGQQVGDVPLLVAVAAMHERVLAEDVLDRAPQRLAAVDHEQDRLLGVQAAVDEVGQQRAGERGVLGRAFPEPERDLDALRCVIPSATTCVRSAISRPSSIITARRTSSSRRDISSPSAVRVRSTNMLRDRRLRRRRAGGLDARCRRARRPRRTCASRRRRASGPSPPASAGRGRRSTRSVSTGSSCSSSAVRIRGRRTGTRRPPSVIDPSSWP